MITAPFAYRAPETMAEAVHAAAEAGDDEIAVISGGTWVVPEMSLKTRRPALVIDLRNAGVGRIVVDGDSLVIGATVTYTQLARSPLVPAFLQTVARGITGGSSIRNQGTPVGSACYANPSSDAPGALVAAGAVLRAVSTRGTRDIPASEFFRSAFTTALEVGEIVESFLVPLAVADQVHAYEKFKTAQGSWPIATASCLATIDGAVRTVVMGGVSATPVVVDVSTCEDDEIVEHTRSAIIEPWDDVLASAPYRRDISGVLAKRAVAAVRTQLEGTRS